MWRSTLLDCTAHDVVRSISYAPRERTRLALQLERCRAPRAGKIDGLSIGAGRFDARGITAGAVQVLAAQASVMTRARWLGLL